MQVPASSKAGFRRSRFPISFLPPHHPFLQQTFAQHERSVRSLARGDGQSPRLAPAPWTPASGAGACRDSPGLPNPTMRACQRCWGGPAASTPRRCASPTKAQKQSSLPVSAPERAFPALAFVKAPEKPDRRQPETGGGGGGAPYSRGLRLLFYSGPRLIGRGPPTRGRAAHVPRAVDSIAQIVGTRPCRRSGTMGGRTPRGP